MTATTKPRIAIPVPHSGNREYSERVMPQYEQAIRQAGGEPVRIPLDRPATELMKLIASCDAVLLPGSRADIDPRRYQEKRDARTNESDPLREETDNSLLQHAYSARKPVLGICYGLQSLNVYRGGKLTQHIESTIDHADRNKTHAVRVTSRSLLAELLHTAGVLPGNEEAAELQVNTSHHQAAASPGNGLRVSAEAPKAPHVVIEGLEGTSAEHFVLAVQWHPERSLEDPASQAIFHALIEAARKRHEDLGGKG
jgi:putative glutamine amidotransferase